MKVFTVCLFIVNSVLLNVESAISQDVDIIADDVAVCRETVMEFSASMKEAKCMPRKTLVRVTPKPGITYIPNMVSVYKCGGFCGNYLSCTAAETRLREFIVESPRNVSTHHRNCHRIYVKEHTRCKCKCTVMKSHCTIDQFYNENKCACECMDVLKEIACSIQKNMVWNPENCKCSCGKPEEECSTGFEWIPSLCRCAKVM